MTEPNADLSVYFNIFPQTAESKVLELLIELGIQVVDAEEGALLLMRKRARELVFSMTVGKTLGTQKLVGQRVPLGQGLPGLAALSGQVQIQAPTFQDPLQTQARSGGAESQLAAIAAPMLAGDSVVGVLTALSFRSDKRFSSRDGSIYGRFAAVAGLLIDQRRRLSDIEEKSSPATQITRRISDAEQQQLRIINSVSRLVKDRPAALEQVARLLEGIEALATGPAAAE